MADNQKMWADLGMNLELHDMLCEVLPGAIGDVFMSQENRPAAMDYFDMVLADVHGLRPSELVEFRKNGGKVFGTFCAYVPDEVIFAAGGIATGLCACQHMPADQGYARRKIRQNMPVLQTG